MSNKNIFKAEGWGTWDVRSLASAMHLPTGMRLRFGLDTPEDEIAEFRWKQLSRLGQRMPDCSYAQVELKYNDIILDIQISADGEDLYATADLLTPQSGYSITSYITVSDGFEGVCINEKIEVPQGVWHIQTYSANNNNQLTIKISRNTEKTTAEAIINHLKKAKQTADAWEKRYDDPMSQRAFEGAWRAVMWNTIYAPSIQSVVTIVTRDWCVDGNYGDFVQFEWDTFFAALQSSIGSKELAYNNVRNVLSGITERGFVPSIYCELGKSNDRSMPPVGAYICWKLYEKFGDIEFIKEIFPKLLGWHDWWMKARDGNKDGLLEWGSDNFPSPHPQWEAWTLQAARYESGLDNSPMYDDAEFDFDANVMKLTDVGLNALFAMDAWALANMADILGEEKTANRLRAEHATIAELVNDLLWSEPDCIYLNKDWDGKFSKRLGAPLFYPLIGRIAPLDRASKMINEVLLDEKRFLAPAGIPAISRDDTAYKDQEYWRGRVWGPMNWLVFEGLLAYGFTDAAMIMGERCAVTFDNEWKNESHVHENYNGETGDGDDANYSDPVYFWGGILGLIGINAREILQ